MTMTTVATAKLSARRIRLISTRSIHWYHSWAKSASAVKLDDPATISNGNTSESHYTPRPHLLKQRDGNVRTTQPLDNQSQHHRRRQVLEVKGVSVIYQQSATAMHRRKKEDRQAGIASAPGGQSPVATTGGSVVATMSATERHRQTRKSARGNVKAQAGSGSGVPTKTNPSAMRLPIDEDEDHVYDEAAVQQVYKSESAPCAEMANELEIDRGKQNDKTARSAGKTAILLITGASSILLVIASLSPL